MPKPLPPVISEDEVGTTEYLRLREETLRRYSRPHDPYRRRPDPGPEPRDQYWTLRRGWTGQEYFVPGAKGGLGDEWVRRQYNPLDALKED
jgi:hypothetical protein